jgi:hypothetical protein
MYTGTTCSVATLAIAAIVMTVLIVGWRLHGLHIMHCVHATLHPGTVCAGTCIGH